MYLQWQALWAQLLPDALLRDNLRPRYRRMHQLMENWFHGLVLGEAADTIATQRVRTWCAIMEQLLEFVVVFGMKHLNITRTGCDTTAGAAWYAFLERCSHASSEGTDYYKGLVAAGEAKDPFRGPPGQGGGR